MAPASAGEVAILRLWNDDGGAPAGRANASGRHRPAGHGCWSFNGKVKGIKHGARGTTIRTRYQSCGPTSAPPHPFRDPRVRVVQSSTTEASAELESCCSCPCLCNVHVLSTWTQSPNCTTVSSHVQRPFISVSSGYGGEERRPREAGEDGSSSYHNGRSQRARKFIVPNAGLGNRNSSCGQS